MAQLPAKQDQYVKYAEKDSKGRNIADEVDKLNKPTLMENIVDSDGNKRFVEGENIITELPEGVHITYSRWSLSGTHLMVVIAGDIDNGTTLPGGNAGLFVCSLPEYILNKIVPVWSNNMIEVKTVVARNDNWSTQQFNVALGKIDTGIRVYTGDTTTFTADRSFRIQFDLLIDSQPSD